MRKLLATFIFILLSIQSHAQDATDLLITRVCEAMLLGQTGTLKDECIRDEETGMALSCYDINSRTEWVCDFNGDGETDIMVYFMDAGLGGGGNAFGYDYKVILMKNDQIGDILSIFGGGKFSYGLLEIDSIRSGRIYATCSENKMSRTDFEDETPLRSAKLEFEYKDGMMLEQSYLRCPIANMDKRIFKDGTIYKVERNAESNDLYELEQWEKLFLKEDDPDDLILASISGCENINLRFSYNISHTDSISQKHVVKARIMYFLNTLQENTRYASTLKMLSDKVADIVELESTEYSLVRQEFLLTNKWNAYVLVNEYTTDDKKDLSITINLTKTESSKPDDYWSAITR